jgi:hypothetical protein
VPPFLGYPQFLVGGQGVEPRRFYLAVNRDRRAGGSSRFRSDDDGATWNEVLAYRLMEPSMRYATDRKGARLASNRSAKN